MACISHTPTATPAQLLIKSTPFCIIDSFPSRNGPHVTRIVSRLKSSWPTSAVNHKLPLTRRIHSATRHHLSLFIFVLGQTIVLVSFCVFFFFFCNLSRPDPSSLPPPSEGGLWFVNTMMSGTTLKRLTKWRGTVTSHAHTISQVRMRKWRSNNTQTHIIPRH